MAVNSGPRTLAGLQSEAPRCAGEHPEALRSYGDSTVPITSWASLGIKREKNEMVSGKLKGCSGLIVALGIVASMAMPASGQNINIDYDVTFGTPSPAYGAGAAQPGIWNNPAGGVTTAQPLVDITGTPTTATIRMVAANFGLSFDNVGTSGDDQALMDDGLDLGGTGSTDTFLIEHLSAGTYSVYTYAWAPDSATYVTSVDVNGTGLQNCGGAWPGAQTLGITYTQHDNIVVPADGTITIVTATVTTFSTITGIQLVGGAADQGRCCDMGGGCTITTEANCLAPSVFGGLGTSCGGDPCRGRCCDTAGGCEVTGPADCAAPSVFAGLGTNCNGSPCMGRCCAANGSCSVAPVITCNGTSTPGLLNCDAVSVYQFDVNMVMADVPDGVLSQSFQTIESPGPIIITDLDVDLNALHTWPGDVQITIEHLGTSVIIYDRPGNPTSTFGCATDHFNIILDDEGTGGPIETVCNAAAPSALSPPNYTPNNPLSAFDGLDAVGEWTITSRDFFTGGDTGTLVSWSLHISSDGPVCPIGGCTCFGDLTGDGMVDGRDVNAMAACVISAGGAGCDCADVDHAGGVTAADIAPFITAMLNGACAP